MKFFYEVKHCLIVCSKKRLHLLMAILKKSYFYIALKLYVAVFVRSVSEITLGLQIEMQIT